MKKYLINPFEIFNDKKILLCGIVLNLVGVLLCFQFNMKFIGFLKLDFVSNISLLQVLLQIVIIIFSLTLLLFITGKIVNPKTRVIDILNSSLLAIIPFYLLTFFNISNFIFDGLAQLKSLIVSQNLENINIYDLPVIVIFSIFTIIILIWSVIILYQGFKTATNCKEVKHNVYFGLAFVLADVLSRFLISNLN